MSPFDRERMVFNGNNASILYRFQDTASYMLKFAKFDLPVPLLLLLPYLHLAPPLGVTPFEFQKKTFRIRKLDLLGYDVALFA